jgi:hypothetical protein
MKPATRVNEFTLDIIEFCENDPYLYKELNKEREKFFTAIPEKYYKTFDDQNWAELRFADHFIFSYISQYYEMTPLEVFLSKMLSNYNQHDQQIFLGFKGNIFSAFTITKVVVGSYFMAKDLTSGKEYKVKENKATHQLKEGDYIVGRILPYETDYALSNVNLTYPKESSYILKRLWKSAPSDITRIVTPLMIEKDLFQKHRDIPKEEDHLEPIERKLKHLLKRYLGKKAPSIKNLRKKINRITDPFPLMRELSGKINFPSAEELMEFQKLFMDFWNLSSRDEFQGKSPQEINEQNLGPKEKELVQDLMFYVQSEIDPGNFSNQNELNKAVKRCQERWLHQPQEELNDKTPWEAILEEREKLGNPRKDYSISMTITPVSCGMKEEYIDLTGLSMKDTPLVKDLETFVNYFIENKVKVTLKNRWIPFEHLKLAEKKFINKDNFNFLGKEEKRGEEPYKKYICFIDSLSRAAKFIYLDKKGWVQVNVRHFKEFSEKSYGEKLFELLFAWVEKVNWTKLQIRDFITIYAKEYQETFIDLLYRFHKYEVNEKIKTEELIHQLYGSEIKNMESPEEAIGHLTIMIEVVMLLYLKWLGVINTQKEKIFPGRAIGWIKEFWVTPKGKKLINKMIDYYLRIGKIK